MYQIFCKLSACAEPLVSTVVYRPSPESSRELPLERGRAAVADGRDGTKAVSAWLPRPRRDAPAEMRFADGPLHPGQGLPVRSLPGSEEAPDGPPVPGEAAAAHSQEQASAGGRSRAGQGPASGAGASTERAAYPGREAAAASPERCCGPSSRDCPGGIRFRPGRRRRCSDGSPGRGTAVVPAPAGARRFAPGSAPRCRGWRAGAAAAGERQRRVGGVLAPEVEHPRPAGGGPAGAGGIRAAADGPRGGEAGRRPPGGRGQDPTSRWGADQTSGRSGCRPSRSASTGSRRKRNRSRD